MKVRRIDRGMFSNEKIGALPMPARWLLVGLITQADDQGRLPAHAALLRSAVFPYDDVTLSQINEWLRALEGNGTISVYERDGKQFVQLLNWWTYQDRMQYAEPSRYPPPDSWQDRVRVTHTKGIIVTHNWTRRDGSLAPDTCDAAGRLSHGLSQPIQIAPVLDLAIVHSNGTESNGSGGNGAAINGSGGNGAGYSAVDYTKRVSRTCGIDARKFVNGFVPKGTGITALEVYYEYVSCRTELLSEYNKDRILEVVLDLAKWRHVVEEWLGVGFRPNNVSGMLEWYQKGIPDLKGRQHAKTRSAETAQVVGGDSQVVGAKLGRRATSTSGEASKLARRR